MVPLVVLAVTVSVILPPAAKLALLAGAVNATVIGLVVVVQGALLTVTIIVSLKLSQPIVCET